MSTRDALLIRLVNMFMPTWVMISTISRVRRPSAGGEGEDDGGGGPCVLRRTGAVGFDLGAGQPCLAACRGMGGNAVFTGITLGNGQRDAFAGLWVQPARFGNFVKAQEGFQRIWRLRQSAEQVRDHAEFAADRVEQCRLFGVGGLLSNNVDTAHDKKFL